MSVTLEDDDQEEEPIFINLRSKKMAKELDHFLENYYETYKNKMRKNKEAKELKIYEQEQKRPSPFVTHRSKVSIRSKGSDCFKLQ